MVREEAGDLGPKRVGIGQIRHPNGPAPHLVLIRRADAAAGRADLAGARLNLTRRIEVPVQGQDKAGVVSERQQVRPYGDPLRGDASDLVQQRPRIDDDAVADDAGLALHHAGRQQRQLVGLVAHHQGVTCVMAALKPHHHIGAVGQPVDNLTFTLVAPLGADNGDIGHG